MTKRLRVAVLISGRGSNMASLLRAAADPGYPAKICAVISNDPAAPGLALASAAGVEALALDHAAFGRDRQAHEAAIDEALRARGIEMVCLAGYMRMLSPFFVRAWEGRLINIHPSLLPAFPGLHTHARALAAGVKLHGCTVHWVNEGMDEGRPIVQAAVPVLPHDTEKSLAERVLAQEHVIYPLALRIAAGGKAAAAPGNAALVNPAGQPAPTT